MRHLFEYSRLHVGRGDANVVVAFGDGTWSVTRADTAYPFTTFDEALKHARKLAGLPPVS